jgi:hypothetical protein
VITTTAQALDRTIDQTVAQPVDRVLGSTGGLAAVDPGAPGGILRELPTAATFRQPASTVVTEIKPSDRSVTVSEQSATKTPGRAGRSTARPELGRTVLSLITDRQTSVAATIHRTAASNLAHLVAPGGVLLGPDSGGSGQTPGQLPPPPEGVITASGSGGFWQEHGVLPSADRSLALTTADMRGPGSARPQVSPYDPGFSPD